MHVLGQLTLPLWPSPSTCIKWSIKLLISKSYIFRKYKIPFEGNSFALGKELDMDPLSAAMNGGDDNRLLFVIPILHLEKFRRDFQTFDIIGHTAQAEAGCVLVTPEGVEFPIKAQGWAEKDE